MSSTSMRSNRLLALALAIALTVVGAGVASAHETVVTSSNPADKATVAQAPAKVTVVVSEEAVSGKSGLKVLDAAGKQVDKADGGVDLNDPAHKTLWVSLPAGLAAGVYTVQWQVTLTDNDTSTGQLTFTVGGAVAAPPAAAPTQPTAAVASVASPMPAITPAAVMVTPMTLVLRATPAATTVVPSTLPSTGADSSVLTAVAVSLLAVGAWLRRRP